MPLLAPLAPLVAGALALALPLIPLDGPAPRPAEAPRAAAPAGEPEAGTVLVVSIDGLNPRALSKLGRRGAPTLHRLVAEGASTMNARTEVEMTLTLPNHTGMVTGRRIEAATGGHGVVWNDDRKRPGTVQAAAGSRVASVFTVVDSAGGDSALFASKTKFSLWQRSWRDSIERVTIEEDNSRLTDLLVADLARDRDFRLLHFSEPDAVGHERGFMGKHYLRAVRRVDRWLGEVVSAVDSSARLREKLTLVVTADHGGHGERHSDSTRRANYRIPFLVRGPGVPAGADLYDLNPDYANPGRRQPAYAEKRQPVRNGAVANLALDLLDLPSVPGSEHNAAQDLDVTP